MKGTSDGDYQVVRVSDVRREVLYATRILSSPEEPPMNVTYWISLAALVFSVGAFIMAGRSLWYSSRASQWESDLRRRVRRLEERPTPTQDTEQNTVHVGSRKVLEFKSHRTSSRRNYWPYI